MNVWLFDAENKSHRIAQLNKNILVLGVDRGFDRNNFLEPPPGIPIHNWIPILVELVVNEFTLLDAGTAFLRDSILDCIKEFGSETPNFIDVLEFIEKKFRMIKKGRSSREVEWAASVINRLSSITNELRLVLDCNKGFGFEKLARRSIIFQLRDLSKRSKNLYVKIVCLKLYHYQMNRETDEKFLIILDEAHLYLPRSGDYRDDTNFLVTLMWQARKRGIYFLSASQSPDTISMACLNSGVVGSFSQSGKAGIQEIESPLLLNEEMKYEISQLPKRTAVIKTPHFPQPVCFQVSDFSPPELSQADCDIMMQPQLSELFYDVVKVKPIQQQKSDSANEKQKDQPKPQSEKQKTEQKTQATLSENEVHWLVALYDNPWLLLGEHNQNLKGKMSSATVIKWRDKLIQKSYFRKEELKKVQGRPTFLVFEERGTEWIKQMYGGTAKIKMQGGDVLHQFIIERVAMKMKGKIKRGNTLSGVEADLTLDGKICVEAVNTHFSVENLQNYLAHYEEVWVVFLDEKKLASSQKKAEKELKEGLEKISWKMIKEFL